MASEISLDLARLENVKRQNDGTIQAACPACRAADSDKSRDHLRIQPDGKFGCAVNPGNHEHRKEIFKIAGNRRSPASWRTVIARPSEKPRTVVNSETFDWANCVAALTEDDAKKLALRRGFSIEFVRWLHSKSVIGILNGNISFANHGAGGEVVSAHVRPASGKWFFQPKGQRVAPLVFGDLKTVGQVFVFESQWDAFAVMDRFGWHEDNGAPGFAVFITRGAGNGKLISGHVNSAALVYAFKQNDQPTAKNPIPAGNDWLADIASNAGCRVLNVATPEPHKDANDWTRAGATKADLEAAIKSAKPMAPIITEPGDQAADDAEPRIIVLPSGSVSISESARAIFKRIAPSQTLFWRGGALVELVRMEGMIALDLVRPEGFCSRVDKFGSIFAWRSDNKGNPSLKPSQMTLDCAKKIMAATEAREFLPPVASVLRCPVLVESKSGEAVVLDRGYHDEFGGLLIVAGETPPKVRLADAVADLQWLIEEFDFQTEADRSRAIASFITPALRIGGLLRGNIPIDCAEADQSQAGKGYRHSLVSAIYNEAGYFVTAKSGGVGSVDESFAAALVAGRPFICLDNFRGKMDSQNLEAFLTCPSLFPARIPHRGEVQVDPKRFILQMSSNGLETTRDLANRASICRIRKRPGFLYRRDPLAELQRRQPHFLGCVFAIIEAWIAKGKPRTSDTRHDFREWCQILDWIIQNVMDCAPLMDGHEAAQERTSNPTLTWLRAVALAVDGENRLGSALIASELVEVCELHSIEIPGKPADEGRAKRQVGLLCKQVFRESDSIKVDGFTVTRGQREYRKPSGDMDATNAYTFTK